ncbi:DUF421 domain-containing protein [Cytophagaceae bacterium YF14B1]|uniref:DUF421 domain-containing protein n=1 Tax=Xanthocytophaga flava TaxID=3048013 RepID=A0AAE3QSP6_9BACT|nr:YetF domain-containing protein [Xanthocytophaga flavus]MDJ1482531.1 DUF421 domain-containing protein [Xanthocytophaga flavus]
MKKEDIHLGDWQRILLGDAPAIFLLEVFLRTIFIFLFLLVITRLLGKRMNAQLSLTEMSVMITLGAIVSAPMQDPIRGLLPGVVILLCVLVVLRGLNLLSYKYRKIELLVQGDVRLLVKDGILQLDQIRQEGFEREQIFAHLRSENIIHLGQIARVYLEACGTLSIYKSVSPKPGLSVLPSNDRILVNRQAKTHSHLACASCGYVVTSAVHSVKALCPNCQSIAWTEAFIKDTTIQNKNPHSGPTDPELTKDDQKNISSYTH